MGQVRAAEPHCGLVMALRHARREVRGMTEYTCSACGQRFNSEDALREHEKTCKNK